MSRSLRTEFPAFPRRGGCARKKWRAASKEGADGAVESEHRTAPIAGLTVEDKTPLLGKGGVAAPAGADGVVRPNFHADSIEVRTNHPVRALLMRLRGISFMGASTPPLPRRGVRTPWMLFSIRAIGAR